MGNPKATQTPYRKQSTDEKYSKIWITEKREIYIEID